MTVGASVSAADTAVSLVGTAKAPIHCVTRGRYNVYFGNDAFQHPMIQERGPISHISVEDRTIHFEDGSSETGVDNILFGTGFTWTLPFLPAVQTRNNRVPDLYQHTFYRHDPTLVFVGAVCHLSQTSSRNDANELNRSEPVSHSKSSSGRLWLPHAC